MPKEPLTRAEESVLLQAARDLGGFRDGPLGVPVNAERTVLLFIDTGIHPSVLSQDRFRLRVERDIGGRPYVVWDRPKKRGRAAYTRVPASKRISPWVEAFIAAPRPRYRQFWNLLLRAVADRVPAEASKGGLARYNVCPVALRHTAGVRLLDLTGDSELVRQVLNCSRDTLDYYLKLRGEMIDEKLDRAGW